MAVFYVENSSPREIEEEIDKLIDIIKTENAEILSEFGLGFSNYLSSLDNIKDKEKIIIKIENIAQVKVMFATKLREHDKKLIEQGIKQGIEQGIKEKSLEVVKRMLENNLEIEFIEKITGLSKDEIKKL